MKDICAIDDGIDPRWRYSQVPAFAAADRAMIDVLTVTREGRLAVLELKANEDIHLPLQGIDYWARVAWHHSQDDFQKFGYFPGRELSSESPLLMMVAPALLEGMRWPHDVQKLAASSTSVTHDVHSAIHFAPGIFASPSVGPQDRLPKRAPISLLQSFPPVASNPSSRSRKPAC